MRGMTCILIVFAAMLTACGGGEQGAAPAPQASSTGWSLQGSLQPEPVQRNDRGFVLRGTFHQPPQQGAGFVLKGARLGGEPGVK